jgi:hypothetical protein
MGRNPHASLASAAVVAKCQTGLRGVIIWVSLFTSSSNVQQYVHAYLVHNSSAAAVLSVRPLQVAHHQGWTWQQHGPICPAAARRQQRQHRAASTQPLRAISRLCKCGLLQQSPATQLAAASGSYGPSQLVCSSVDRQAAAIMPRHINQWSRRLHSTPRSRVFTHCYGPSLSCLSCSTIYNMCTQKPPYDYSEQLYQRYKDAFNNYINEMVSRIVARL